MLRKIWNDESGVAMTEYIIILVMVAISAIAVVTLFGDKIKDLFTNATTGLDSMTDDSETTTGSK